jgi:hypothetical protein
LRALLRLSEQASAEARRRGLTKGKLGALLIYGP